MTKLEFFSLGLVAEDKIKDDWEIRVIPIEKVPTITGDISERMNVTGEITDRAGNITSLQMEKKKYITALWLPDGLMNRATAPDVTKGMTVKLFNYAGTNQYYWTTLYNEFDLFKKEKVVYLFSNKSDIASTAEDIRNKSYYLQVDTYDKFIRLHTANNDGEPVAFDLEVDAANGVITIQDSKSNKIELLSQDDTLNINVNKNVNINAGDNLNIKTPKNIELDLDKISVKNSTAELIDLLIKLVETNKTEIHLGNMGATTVVMQDWQDKYQEIIDKLKTFKV